jgi:hypothetical protein
MVVFRIARCNINKQNAPCGANQRKVNSERRASVINPIHCTTIPSSIRTVPSAPELLRICAGGKCAASARGLYHRSGIKRYFIPPAPCPEGIIYGGDYTPPILFLPRIWVFWVGTGECNVTHPESHFRCVSWMKFTLSSPFPHQGEGARGWGKSLGEQESIRRD